MALVHRLERSRRRDLIGIYRHFQIARFEFFHAAAEYDAAAVDEHEIGEDVLDLFELMGGHEDGPAAIEVVVQQGIVELLAIQDVEAEGRLVQHQQLRVNGHDQGEVQLGYHALRQFPDLAGEVDACLRKKTFRLRAIESRMHAGDVFESLRNPDPPWQHRDIGDEADIAHELIALGPGIASEDLQFSLIWGEAEDRVERDGCAEGLAQAAGFDYGHDFGSFSASFVSASFVEQGVAAASSSSSAVRPS